MENLIVIPTYNEAQNIGNLIKSISKTLNGIDFGILVVDDASIDGTQDVVLDIINKTNNVYLLNRESKMGLASAYVDGFQYGIELGYNKFIEMDADFSHDPCYLPMMIEKLNDYDVVIGSRYVKDGGTIGWDTKRQLVSSIGSLYSKTILNCPINDLTGGFNGWKLDALDRIGLHKIISKGYSFQIEMKYRAYKNNCSIYEFPIIFKDRKFGTSKMDNAIFLEAFINVLKLRFMRVS